MFPVASIPIADTPLRVAPITLAKPARQSADEPMSFSAAAEAFGMTADLEAGKMATRRAYGLALRALGLANPQVVALGETVYAAQCAACHGAKLLLTPESYLDGWSFDKDILDRVATTVPGPQTEELGSLARHLGVWLCVAMFVREDGQVFNAAVIIDDSGGVQGIYRKTHETRPVLESMPYDLGGDLPVFDTPWGVVGVLICHDRWYPEAARALRRRGAEMILNPVAAAIRRT